MEEPGQQLYHRLSSRGHNKGWRDLLDHRLPCPAPVERVDNAYCHQRYAERQPILGLQMAPRRRVT